MAKKKQSPTRAPKRPPFAVGTTLKYVGTSRITGEDFNAKGERVTWTLLEPGMVVEIDEVKLGRRGTGEQLSDHDGPMFDDDGEPYIDETRDGTSCYHVVDPNGRAHGRLILNTTAKEWEVVEPAPTFAELCKRGLQIEVCGPGVFSKAHGEPPRFAKAKVTRWTASWLHIQVEGAPYGLAFTAADIKRYVRRAR